MNIESNKYKLNIFVFIIVGEIIVGILLVEYLFVGILSEDVILMNNREVMLGLIKVVIVVGFIGVLIICLYFILCLCVNICRLLD